MKPLYLAFQGLHSYRDEAVVDFERLGERGLFGIFGPTGAGKSTILDAVTLALYGEVERVQGGKRQGIAHPEADEIRVTFRFEAGGGARYEVRRLFRAKDGGIENKAARLDRLDGGVWMPVADKAKTVDEAVERVVGLTSENFRRVVVLPQGKFADFLQLTGAKRRAMLETILGLERFGESLFRKVADRRRAVQTQLDRGAGQLKALEHATKEAVEKARADRDAKRAAVAEAEAALGVLAAQLAESRAVSALQAEVRKLEAKHAELVSRTEAVDAQRAELDAAGRAEPLRPLLEDLHKLARAKAEAEARRKEAEAKELLWAEDLKAAQAAFDAASQALEEGRPRLAARRDELKQAEKLEAELHEHIREANEAAEARAHATEALTRAEAERHRLEGALAAGDQEIAALGEAIAKAQVDPAVREQVQAAFQALGELRQAEKQVQVCAEKKERKQARALETRAKAESAARAASGAAQSAKKAQEQEKAQLAARPGDEKGLREAGKSANLLDNLVEAIAVAEGETAKARQQDGALRAKVAKLEEDQKAAAEAHQQAGQQAEAAQAALDDLARRGAASRLSCTLADGKPCPVCGSTAHPAPAEAADEGERAKAQKACDAARKVAEKAQRKLAEVEAELAALRQARAEAQERLKEVEQTLRLRRSKLPEAQRTHAIEELQAWRAAERSKLARAEETLDRWRERTEALSKAAREAEEGSGKASAQALSLAAEAAGAQVAAQEASAELEDARRAAAAQRAALDEKRGPLAVEAIEAEQESLSRREREAVRLAQAAKLAAQRRRETEEALRGRLEEAGRLGAELEGLGHRAKELSEEQGLLHQRLQGLTGGQSATKLLEACEAELAGLDGTLTKAREALELNQKSHQRAREKRVAEKARFDAAVEQSKKAELRLMGELSSQRFVDAAAARAALRERERREELSDAVKAHEDALREIAGALGAAREQLAGRSVLDAALAELVERHARAEEWARQVREELGELRELFGKLASDRAKREETEAHQQRLQPEYDRLATLSELVEGRKLVEFMAEQEIATIAETASARLRSLTHGRYELVPQQDDKRGAGFVVRDNHHGGVERPVGSLSGGETFLASLAMALALSMQIQMRGEQLKFFFLDEGFGTLDPATLDVAMGALERLQSESLTVGVITHVDEVRSRMPRRLVVTPAQPGGPGSRVAIEEA